MRSHAKRLVRRAVAVVFVAGLLAAPAAHAQTTTAPPYPGEPTTVPPAPTSEERDLGAVETGGTLNVTECNFAPNTVIHITVNGAAVTPDASSDSRGCIVVRVEVLPNLVALGRAPLRPLAATGLAATATNVQVKVNGQTFTVGPYGTVVTVTSTGTGANGAARTATFKFTVVKRGTITRSGLVRTGITVIKWTPLGLGLLGVGYLLVLATRRRRTAAL
jgi:hypothetical protein